MATSAVADASAPGIVRNGSTFSASPAPQIAAMATEASESTSTTAAAGALRREAPGEAAKPAMTAAKTATQSANAGARKLKSPPPSEAPESAKMARAAVAYTAAMSGWMPGSTPSGAASGSVFEAALAVTATPTKHSATRAHASIARLDIGTSATSSGSITAASEALESKRFATLRRVSAVTATHAIDAPTPTAGESAVSDESATKTTGSRAVAMPPSTRPVVAERGARRRAMPTKPA